MRKLALVALTLLVAAPTLGQGDTTSPTVTDITADGTYLPGATLDFAPSQIIVTFSEDMDPATVSTDTFRLVRSGGDGTFGDGNEVEIVSTLVSCVGDTATMSLSGVLLPDDDYHVALGTTAGGPWGSPVNVAELNTSANEFVGSVSPDVLTMYLHSTRSGGYGSADILVSTRSTPGGVWDTPSFVTELNAASWDGDPCVSADGLTMWFASDRAGGQGLRDIWMATRPSTSSAWGTPANAVGLNAGYNQMRPCIALDGLTMWFSSDEFPATGGGWDIWYATRPDTTSAWGNRTQVTELKLSREEQDPWVSRDALTMYYSSDLSGGDWTTYNIWLAERADAQSAWVAKRDVSEINSPSMENRVWVSSDGLTIWLSSDRSGGTGGVDIWKADAAQIPPSDWTGNLLDGEFSGSFPSGDGAPGGDFACAFAIDTTPPTVLSTSPTGGTTITSVDESITVTFSEPMDETTLLAAFSTSPGIAGTPIVEGNVLTLTPLGGLANGTTYTVTVTTVAEDPAGHALESPCVFSFTLEDDVVPDVVATSPADGATDVPLSGSITVTFTEIMDPTTTAAAFSIDPAVGGTPTVSGTVLTLLPSGGLESDTQYTVTISTSATDLVGLPLAADYTFSFTTIDLTAPADVTEYAAIPSNEQIELSWRNPFDMDFAGVVVVRSVDEAPTGSPADGATYAAGNIIANGVVLHVGTAATGIPGSKSGWSEVGVEEGREYFYAVFTYDERMNYSSGVTASAVPGASGGGDGGLCSPGSSGSPVLLALALAALATLASRQPSVT